MYVLIALLLVLSFDWIYLANASIQKTWIQLDLGQYLSQKRTRLELYIL